MDNPINIHIQDNEMPSTFEELEVRRALNKKHLPNPDVNAEWEQFIHTLQQGNSNVEEDNAGEEKTVEENSTIWQRHSHQLKLFATFIAGVAATLTILVIFPWLRQPNKMEVFTANQNEQEIVVTSDDGDMTVVKNHQPMAFNKPANSPLQMIRKTRMMEVSTPRGTDYQLTLPDGTHVWLNADSKISFPERFTGNDRKVKIEGEAYFDVTKDAKHPFIISTDYFTTTVHGTSFNVNAYSAKTAGVALVTGSVSVKSNDGKELRIVPGQLACIGTQGKIEVKNVDVYPLTQWKDGFFYFDNERLVDIMMELGRWYNVSVVFEHEEDMNQRLHFVAEHKEKLSDIIKRINDLNIVKITLEKDHVSIQ